MPPTNLEDYAQRARRRLLIAAIVGAVCFASGVGLVAALAPDEAGDEAPMPADGPPAAPAEAGTPAEPAPKAPAPKAPSDPTPAAPAAPATPVAVPTPSADAGQPHPATPEPDAGATPIAAPDTPDADGEKWWESLRGKRCTVVYGEHQRLVVREGSLRRDETTTYGPFTDNNVVARVRRENKTQVTVHHFGIHPRNGRPSLAHVTVHVPSGDVTGILPLQIGGDQILLKPLTKGAP